MKLLVLFRVAIKGPRAGDWVISVANMNATLAYFPERIEEKYNH